MDHCNDSIIMNRSSPDIVLVGFVSMKLLYIENSDYVHLILLSRMPLQYQENGCKNYIHLLHYDDTLSIIHGKP